MGLRWGKLAAAGPGEGGDEMAMIEQRLEQAAHDQDGEGDRYGNAALLREAAKVIGEMRAALKLVVDWWQGQPVGDRVMPAVREAVAKGGE